MLRTFHKYEGAGNDMVILDDLEGGLALTEEQIRLICDRRFGVGADGLILLRRGARAPWRMDFYNPDGRPAEMCGNGIRCLARYIWDGGLSHEDPLDIETPAGVRQLKATAGSEVTVSMGRPSFAADDVPVDPASAVVGGRYPVGETEVEAVCLSMGNPHCVLFVDDVDAADVCGVGPAIENLSAFAQRANVEFVQVDSPDAITVRVWERGAGETLACGTGACAAAVASAQTGKTGRHVMVHLPGGTLGVDWRDDGDVLLTGPAHKVFEGQMEV